MKKGDCRKEISQFINDNVAENPEIEDVYHLNKLQDGPVVVCFSSIFEKERIFAKKNLLKDKTTDNTPPVYLNHYLLPVESEKKKRERLIVKENKQLDKPLDIEKIPGGIKIGSSVYVKKVEPPKPTDLLNYSVDELNRALKVSTVKGPEQLIKGNKMIAYAVDTDRIQVVRECFL